MFYFANFMEAYKILLDMVLNYGVEVMPETVHNFDTRSKERYLTKELIGVFYYVSDLSDVDKLLDFAGVVSREYCEKELEERLSMMPINPGEAWKLKPKKKVLLMKDRFAYTYAERMFYQLEPLLEEMHRHPHSRQLVLSIWDAHQDVFRLGKWSVPCTVVAQFLIRKHELHSIWFTRSQDLGRVWPSDVWFYVKIQEWFAKKLHIKVGKFWHLIGSLHIYKLSENEIGGWDWCEKKLRELKASGNENL